MKYINQLDYPHLLYVTRTDMEGYDKERGKTTTIRSSGCGLCSAIMVADRLIPNLEFSLTDAIELSYEVKANFKRGTNFGRFAPAFAERLGLHLETSKDLNDVRRCLRTGGAVVILVDGDHDDHIGLFTKGGHYMAIISEEADGRFAILDPSYKPGKFDEEGRVGKVEVRDDMIVLCDGAILEEETAGKPVPYYLYWRK